jgi:hypothetical protein
VRTVALNTARGWRVCWGGVPAIHVVPGMGVWRGTRGVVSVRVVMRVRVRHRVTARRM